MIKKFGKRGQVTIFIIIAVLIVVAVALYFIFRGSFTVQQIPPEFQPIYDHFLSCIEDDALTGIGVIESQGGYVSLPQFEPGSEYMPFSSQLVFLGNPIPYWYYVSGNNIEKEQVPSVTDMEKQLADFVQGKIRDCAFDEFYDDEFVIELGEPSVSADVQGGKVDVNVDVDLAISRGEDNVFVRNHKVEVDSNLGNLYDSAKKVYDYEQDNLFLEDYAIDILRNYAPVDGVEISCSPEVWEANEVFDNLQNAIDSNTLALNSGLDKYFSVDLPGNGDVRFLTSADWPNTFEVAPSDGNFLVAEPVGNQQGLGIIGFCYVPYHFVYDVKYPVLAQVREGDEIFQFPLAVIIDNNNPRKSLEGDALATESPELCADKNTQVHVRTYDSDLNPVDARISYECVNQICNIGTASSGVLEADFPQCANGYIVAQADGYAKRSYLFSTVQSGSVEIIMDKIYPKQVVLNVDGKRYNGEAIIYFSSDADSKTVVYPDQKSVELSEGNYDVQVYIYKDSSIEIGAATKQQCIEVARGGIGGLLGLTQQECFDLDIPEQIISNALAGGGEGERYVLDSELASSETVEINVQSLPEPDTLEKLQDNYELFQSNGVDVRFI
jgi:hypothetical protein